MTIMYERTITDKRKDEKLGVSSPDGVNYFILVVFKFLLDI